MSARLVAGLHGGQERHHGHDRLAGADVALQEAVHRDRAGQVRPDLGPDALLRRREGEGQAREEPRRRARRAGARATPRLAGLPPAPERQADLEHEEVLEGEPAAGRLHVLEPLREVDGPVRRGHRQEVSPPAQLVGQDVGSLVGVGGDDPVQEATAPPAGTGPR